MLLQPLFPGVNGMLGGSLGFRVQPLTVILAQIPVPVLMEKGKKD